ncbi:MAG TPA: VWA domain-containing protein [Pyrinomonadaceae bacterium]|nr:VWA domain-containing protein [Pyrinomonadaceae bacterium]
MNQISHLLRPVLMILWLGLCVSSIAQVNKPETKLDDVVRVTTQLVQTDVLVLDNKGQFVEGLKPENFEIKINGKPRPVSFLDHFTAGSASEEARIAAARGSEPTSANRRFASIAFDRGRTILFYLDDYHLSANSITRLREVLTAFVENEMGPNDEVGIITVTGQLGFLEQLTGEKVVLRRAIQKLAHRSITITDAERPPMSEAEAIAIVNGDRRIHDYFLEQLLREMGQPRPRQPSGQTRTRSMAGSTVSARAKSIVDQSAALSGGALSGFEKFIRSTATLPWQKLAFFVSDGFELTGGRSGYDLRLIADAATRSGTTVYTIDARGLISGSPEAAKRMAFDNTGRLASAGTRAVTSPQEVLRTVAFDGGGHPILDSNAPILLMKRAISETANYYQLSWRPEEHEIRDRNFQAVEIKVLGKDEVVVRTRQGFYFEPEVASATGTEKSEAGKKKEKSKGETRPLRVALRNPFPSRGIPISISAGHMETGEPTMLVTATVEVQKEALDLGNRQGAFELDLEGVLVDETGKSVGDFSEDLTVKPAEILSSASNRVVYNRQLRVTPGLYQMRVAVEEKKTGRIGSAMQWLDVPNHKGGELLLSSLFIGEVDAQTLSSGKLNINADHRFPMRSRLGFLTYIYNAKTGPSGPDVAIQVTIMRDEQPVFTKPLVKVQTSGLSDPSRIGYGEDIDLGALPAGRYILQVNAIDRIGKSTATQQTRFTVH